jgi:ribonuclease HI
MKVTIYTDGSCFQAQESGGWGVYLIQNSNKTIAFSGSKKCKDSVEMELLAISKALEYLNAFLMHIDNLDVVIYTDCDYIVKLINKKNRLSKRTFPIKDKTSKRYKQLLFDICNYQDNIKSIKWNIVKSHSGIKGNEIADSLAKKAAKKSISI